MLSQEEIRAILPHRGQMLMVDHVLEFEPLKHIIGIKRINVTDAMCPAPGKKMVFPNTLVMEAMAQVGGMPMHRSDGTPAFLVALEDFTFENFAYAGEELRIEGTIEWARGRLFKVKVVATTEGGFQATGRILYGIDLFQEVNAIRQEALVKEVAEVTAAAV